MSDENKVQWMDRSKKAKDDETKDTDNTIYFQSPIGGPIFTPTRIYDFDANKLSILGEGRAKGFSIRPSYNDFPLVFHFQNMRSYRAYRIAMEQGIMNSDSSLSILWTLTYVILMIAL